MPPPRDAIQELLSQYFVDKVARTIRWRLRLPHGRCTVENVAADLAMRPATLRWRLARRGAGFAQLLVAEQIRLVEEVLADPMIPLKFAHIEIGFADREGLNKWCRRNLHARPSEVRARLVDPTYGGMIGQGSAARCERDESRPGPDELSGFPTVTR